MAEKDNHLDTDKSKKKPRRKRSNYKQELEKEQIENVLLKEQLLRFAAEFDNYKKRSERERSAYVENANRELVARILSVLDDLERSIEVSRESEDLRSFKEGVELVYKNLVKILAEEGLKQFVSIGQHFDPERHEALMLVSVKEKESNVIVDENIKGYEFKSRVLRPAKVIVNK